MFSVAIDGPSGAGKSSISKAAAEKLGFIYIDTGALYRTVALYLVQNKIDPADADKVEGALPKIRVEMKHTKDGQRMYLCGDDVTDKIRTQEVSNAASVSSVLPVVRNFLFSLQTEMADKYNVIMDGRDIGTVVLPNAQVKIFLTASAEERAKRRCEQNKKLAIAADYDTILRDIIERDERDSGRAVAPLKPAEDAVFVDSTGNTVDETIEVITGIIKDKM